LKNDPAAAYPTWKFDNPASPLGWVMKPAFTPWHGHDPRPTIEGSRRLTQSAKERKVLEYSNLSTSENQLSLSYFRDLEIDSFDMISVDIFDTLLLRDHTVQRLRFREVAKALSGSLQALGWQGGVSILFDVRRRVHDSAYRAVALERPDGDATLSRMAEIQALLLGLDKSTISLFIAAELEIERLRLTANKFLCPFLKDLRRQGKRVIAISDTYLSVQNLEDLIRDLVHDSPVQKIYSSSDLGLTKHSGRVFERVATLENVPLGRIVHCGDNEHSDVRMARAAGCQAILLPRPAWMRLSRKLFAALTLFGREIG
jgi:HAD superfamily hydrolase (TIGR01549 family)